MIDVSCVRWVVFDAVGTLLTPHPGVADAYFDIGRRYGSKLTVNEVSRRFRDAFRRSEEVCFPASRRGRTSEPEEEARWRWIVATVLSDVTNAESCFRDLWQHFARPDNWQCYSDVSGTLETLSSRGYRLAMASNFDARLHAICAGRRELQTCTSRLVSSEVGSRKPASEFYSAVLAHCGVERVEVLMVGDDFSGDSEAPRTFGFQALWLDRRGQSDGGGVIRSLIELLDLLPARP